MAVMSLPSRERGLKLLLLVSIPLVLVSLPSLERVVKFISKRILILQISSIDLHFFFDSPFLFF